MGKSTRLPHGRHISPADPAVMTMLGTFLRRQAEPQALNAYDEAVLRQPWPRSGAGALELAVLVYDFRSSGVVLNAIRIAAAARAAGIAVELWTVRPDGSLRETLPAGLGVRSLRSSATGLSRSIDSLAAVPRLIAALRQHRPALLFSAGNHVHGFATLAHRLAGIPGTKLIGRVSNALAATVPPKRSGLIAAFARLVARGQDRLQYGAMDACFAVSRELGGDLVRHGGARSGEVTVIPNGVDLSAIAAKGHASLDHPWFAPDAPPVIVAAGRLCRQKNVEQLIDAFAQLCSRMDARLVILGSGAKDVRRALEARAARLEVGEHVWFAGYQANPYRFFARARLFAMTSRWEGGSNVLIEALASGLPVVATACPAGVREVLADSPVGRLVPVGAVEATAEAMQALLSQPHQPQRSRALAARFPLEACLAAYVRAFEAYLGRAQASDLLPWSHQAALPPSR